MLSWSSPIGLPNIIWQNVLLGGLVGVVGVGAGVGLGGLVGIGYAGEIFLQYVTDTTIISLVEKHGLESIKPLHEAGAKFSDLCTSPIQMLVEKYGIKILHPESIKDEIIADEILIESQKETSLIQKENIYYDTAEKIEDTNTTDTYDNLEGN